MLKQHFTINYLPNTSKLQSNDSSLLVHNKTNLSILLTNNRLTK